LDEQGEEEGKGKGISRGGGEDEDRGGGRGVRKVYIEKKKIMEMRKISYEQYLDKIWGGWVGKCAGGILGAPIEGFKCFHSIQFSEELFKTNYPNDDLDLQVLWLDLVKKKSP